MTNLLTTSEVAKYLKVSRDTVYEMIHRGEIVAERWGTLWRVREDALVKRPEKPKRTSRARWERDEWARRHGAS